MSGRNIYLLTYLPTPGQLGDQPAVSCSQFLSLLNEDDEMSRPGELARVIMLSDDLLQRDSHLAGEIDQADEADPKACEPIILTAMQLCDEEPLPEYLAPPGEAVSVKIPADVVWETYFRYAMTMGQKYESNFLIAWVGFEIALRNALAEERAKALELEPTDYFVAEDLADTSAEFSAALNEWSLAANPMVGQRVLDSARWRWLKENDTYFSFDDEELAAYAAKLMLQQRWGRLTELMETSSSK